MEGNSVASDPASMRQVQNGAQIGDRVSANLTPANLPREQSTSRWQVTSRGRGLGDFVLASLPASESHRERLLLALAGLFVLVGAVTLSLSGLDHWSTAHWVLVVIWLLCFGAAHLVLCRYVPDRDPFLIPLTGLLSGWGLLLIARLADISFMLRQSIWLATSVAVFILIAARSPGLRWLRRYRYTWLLGGLALLATTLVWGSNPSGVGPRLWLGGRLPGLGDVYIQPSEILKLLMVAYLASYLADKRALVVDGPRVGRMRLPSLPYLAPLLVMWGFAMVLLAWQQDLGAALLFFLTFLVMLYLASGSKGYVVAGLILFLVATAGAYVFLDTVALRVDIWLNPWSDPDGRAFQIVQSLIAFASGGFVGQGLGQGSPTYIPAIHTDFPFAAIAEEFGLPGTLGLLVAVAVLTLRGVRIALRARSPFRRLLAAGLATLLGLQAWIIMAGSTKLIPLTGVTLPFVSYGGSSLLSSFITVALLMTVSRDERSDRLVPAVGRQQFSGSDMAGPILLVSLSVLIAYAVLAVVSGYWALIRHDDLWTRDDNPRLVEAEQRVRRGPILDRNSAVLARSQADETGIQRRTYRAPTIPAVGYYSLKHGVGGIEASSDSLLRGLEGRSQGDRFLDELLHRQPDGHGLLLTIDAGLQEQIVAMMEEKTNGAGASEGTGWQGAAVLMDIASGEILALVSLPTFNPNTLDSDWEQLESDPAAPLLNRVTQGLYQPGGVLQLVVLADALQAGTVELDVPVSDSAAPVMIDGQTLDCAQTPQGATLSDAVSAACPAPMADLGEFLGSESLETAFRLWGLDAPPPLEIPTEAGEVEVTDPRLAAIGQEALTVTPLHLAMVVAAIGNEGVMPPAHLVREIESADGMRQSSPKAPAIRVVNADLAERLLAHLRRSTDGQVLGHSSLALAGAARPFHVWFLGLAPALDPRYAVVVLLEHGGADGLETAARIGHDSLLAALDRAR